MSKPLGVFALSFEVRDGELMVVYQRLLEQGIACYSSRNFWSFRVQYNAGSGIRGPRWPDDRVDSASIGEGDSVRASS